MTKPVVESKHAWELLLHYWNTRDQVTSATRCPKPIRYLDDREDDQCVLDKSHLEGEILGANVPHADKDGNIIPIEVGWETLVAAKYFEEHPMGEE